MGMHFLREGDFAVAASFNAEVQSQPLYNSLVPAAPASQLNSGEETAETTFTGEQLRCCFQRMYYILGEMRLKNLLPAIEWTREHSAQLDARGSDLEFELGRQQFLCLFTNNLAKGATDPYRNALQYAKQEFNRFQGKYLKEIQQLMGALVFASNLDFSPYRHLLPTESCSNDLSNSFVHEFCSLLGLSADSPLYIASTAGAIALPTLLKLQTIMKEKRTEWTTQHELPVSNTTLMHSPTYSRRLKPLYRHPISFIQSSYVQCQKSKRPTRIRR